MVYNKHVGNMSTEQRRIQLDARHEKIRKDLEECDKGNHVWAEPSMPAGRCAA
jgi:hypothetical protein